MRNVYVLTVWSIVICGCGDRQTPENTGPPAQTPATSEPVAEETAITTNPDEVKLPSKPIDFEAPGDLPLPTSYHVNKSYQLDLNVGHKIAVFAQALGTTSTETCKADFQKILTDKGWTTTNETNTRHIAMIDFEKEKNKGVVRIFTEPDAGVHTEPVAAGVYFQLEVIYQK